MNVSVPVLSSFGSTIPQYEVREKLVQIDDVHVQYGEKVVLRGVTEVVGNIVRPLNSGVTQGQVIALLAPSGKGKTQLFRCISGLQEPTKGKVLLTANGVSVKPGMVGVVPQDYPLFRHRTVLGNLVVAAGLKGLSRKEAKTESLRLLEYFGIKHIAESYPVQISGGQRQRAAIARQILSSSFFLLMDEPFSGQDVNNKHNLVDLILNMSVRDELQTIIVTTHDIACAISIADTLWILGCDYDGEGKQVPGARIQHKFNLIDLGLAWQPGIVKLPRFKELSDHIENDLFCRL